MSETTLVALYRASFFYGVARWTAWLIWAHVVRSFAFDLRWGGPRWVPRIYARELNGRGSGAGVQLPGLLLDDPAPRLLRRRRGLRLREGPHVLAARLVREAPDAAQADAPAPRFRLKRV